ncbi:hypothetical protein TNCV_2630611 [Trichonephila clavipes]|uniref:Uncharacterized protein n=1 Tax=Trichonephila clavipes TaxID=2585209 RepID=A0A8X6VF63_TRICX|nr:hypothetical protein TNCV_2630611 [Trichonephila clavipes]
MYSKKIKNANAKILFTFSANPLNAFKNLWLASVVELHTAPLVFVPTPMQIKAQQPMRAKTCCAHLSIRDPGR